MMRAVFLGFETTILDTLSSCCEIAGVFVAEPRFRLYSLPDWLLSNYPIRTRVRALTTRHPRWLHAWRRRLMRYHMMDSARERGLAQLVSPSANDGRFLSTLSNLRPDIGVVANFGEILREPILRIPRHGFINFHPSLLPQYRGPTPLSRMLLSGEKRAGVTWHRVSEIVDGGEILAQEPFEILNGDTVSELTRRSVELAARMLPPTLDAIEQGLSHPLPQDDRLASYFPKLSPEEKRQLAALERRSCGS